MRNGNATEGEQSESPATNLHSPWEPIVNFGVWRAACSEAMLMVSEWILP